MNYILIIGVTFICMILISIYKKYNKRKNGYLIKKDEFTNFLGIVIVLLFIIITIGLIVLLPMTYQDYNKVMTHQGYSKVNEILKIINKNRLFNLFHSIVFNLFMIYVNLKIWKIEIFKSGVVCNQKSIKWNLIDYFNVIN